MLDRLTTTWLLTGLLAGCSGSEPGWIEVTDPSGKAAAKLEAAERARGALQAQLQQELAQAIGSGGPANGIRVCSERAPQIARAVGEEQGVAIGRTSHKLRNPANRAPEWAQPVVATMSSEPRFFEHSDGSFGATFPIPLAPVCATCHGPEEQLAEEVRTALSEAYPTDAATGFAPGDLRGWFWVEVP